MIVFPAIVLGFGFLFESHVSQYSGETAYDRAEARSEVEQDTRAGMRFRFETGAAVGGGLGLIYVIC